MRVSGLSALGFIFLTAEKAGCEEPAPKQSDESEEDDGPEYACSCGNYYKGEGAKRIAMEHAAHAEGNHIVKRVK